MVQISFWQDQCREGVCPTGDGSYVSVFPVADSENQASVVDEDSDDERESLWWFIVLAAGVAGLAAISWLVFCCCCTVSVFFL